MPNDLGQFIKDEVARAEGDFQGFRTRSLNLVAMSGVLVTLTTGLLSVAAGSRNDVVPSSALWVVLVTMLAFILAAIFALMIHLTVMVRLPDETLLDTYVRDHWTAPNLEERVAEQAVKYLTSLREANSSAADWMNRAIIAEIVGIGSTALLATLVLQHIS